MAIKTVQIRTSDISGEELEAGKGETVSFSINGSDYQIDVTDSEAKTFHSAFDKYVKSATKVTGRRAGTRRASGSGRTSDELTEIRNWANANGYQVAPRGRVKADIIAAFDKTQG